ncbi:mitochondrial integral membrane protein [Aspergillus taichungensis]|uniref:Mitochondrial integral membrane protein n=1 Tax=Aspergillus taichungensis TaxID=482145 RepID=A0A2J5HLG9_9EURO|nr:mitochondrial integral membrane protein [Aspergillus taichungensis]
MASLWPKNRSPSRGGSRNENGIGNGNRGNNDQESGRQSVSRDPDERTRLLPHGQPGYLSPDDPAVSPLNLWTIRALRGITVTLFAVTFIWWIFLLVSLFVTPPGMHTRGSGFFAFGFTTLTLAGLSMNLLLFAIPSLPMTIWGSVLAGLLTIDWIIILAVPRLRVEEGWVGIASAIWAMVLALFYVLRTRSVAWGKREEEERLTGREETRRPLREWVAVFGETVTMAVLVLVALLFTATLILRARDASLAPPGKRYYVNGDTYQVHLACVGPPPPSTNANDTLPTVLLEAGEGPAEDSLQPFLDDMRQAGHIARYCYWDRPGLGWSENAPSPYSAGMTADALSEALALAYNTDKDADPRAEGPWVLVSAGVGSIYSRIFASRHLLQVQGLLLIDPLHEEYLSSRIGAPGRGFLLWLRGILSPLGVDRLAGAIFKGRTREDRVFGRSAYQGGRAIRAKLQENLVARSLTASEIQTARHVQMADTPLVVVSSGVEVDRSERWGRAQEELTRVTSNLKHWDTVEGAPHEVWRDVKGRQVLGERLRALVRGGGEDA